MLLRHRQLDMALVAGELETILLVRAFRMVLLLSGDDNQIALCNRGERATLQKRGTTEVLDPTWSG
jgi:hypothetical protein